MNTSLMAFNSSYLCHTWTVIGGLRLSLSLRVMGLGFVGNEVFGGNWNFGQQVLVCLAKYRRAASPEGQDNP